MISPFFQIGVSKRCVDRGIKHDFPFINIRKVPREVLKTEGEARDLHPSCNTLSVELLHSYLLTDELEIGNANRATN